MKPSAEIILVHGLWFGPAFMQPLARRLHRLTGLPVRRINYRSTRGDLAEHAERLHRFAKSGDAPVQHFVGHSLGGLVILKMLNTFDDLAHGRVVFLGSPLRGSRVARKARKVPGSEALLGKIQGALQEGFPVVPGDREAGMIAGSRSMGLGWMVGGTDGPGDGTVAVAETIADGLDDHCVLPATHTGMLYSARVAEQAAHFLETGRFER
jgi:pimeloyl-ACP methyl ester carboxylesterase